MPDKRITVQFRTGDLENQSYEADWEEEWEWHEVVLDAGTALGQPAYSPLLTTRNMLTDGEERSLNPTHEIGTETARKMTVSVDTYSERGGD